MRRALLLNASWEPLNFITDERAVLLVLKQRAEIVTNMEGMKSVWEDFAFKTITHSFDVPATVRLLTRVNKRFRPPKFRKKVLFNRDMWTCMYCSTKLNWDTATVEHVLPRSRGGPTTWLNCVASCKPCNKKKANKTPEEAGLRILVQPKMPNSLHFWDISRCRSWHDDWNLWIQEHNSV